MENMECVMEVSVFVMLVTKGSIAQSMYYHCIIHE